MVGLALLALMMIAAPADPPAAEPARPAMEKEKFPWYDAKSDAPRPLWPDEEDDPPSKDGRPSRGSGASSSGGSKVVGAIVMIGMTMAIAAALGAILWAFYRFAPLPRAPEQAPKAVSRSARIESLPADLPASLGDPWAEAVRQRAAGNLAEAIVALYVHLLLALNEKDLIRLAPGKTGRQLVRSLSDPWYRQRVAPTLRLFEASFYGHHPPPPDEFEAAWGQAQAVRARIAGGVAS